MNIILKVLAIFFLASASVADTYKCVDPINNNKDWTVYVSFTEDGRYSSVVSYFMDTSSFSQKRCIEEENVSNCIVYDNEKQIRLSYSIVSIEEYDSYDNKYYEYILRKLREDGTEPTHALSTSYVDLEDGSIRFAFGNEIFVTCEKGDLELIHSWTSR